MPAPRPAAVVVLAAGEGTRMRSATPKVLHELAGRSMVGHVLDAVAALDPEHTVLVVGHGRDLVVDAVAARWPHAQPVVQAQQNGTGHAVRVALAALPELRGTVLVLPGDTPLLRAATLQALLDLHHERAAATTVLTALLDDPTGYGRVLRDDTGAVTGIVEHKDADATQRAVREINTGMYAFSAAPLADALGRLSTDNAQGEEYLTDVVGIHVAAGRPVAALAVDDPTEAAGVNDRVQLARARADLRDRLVEQAMRAGTTVVDPATTWLDVDVVLERDTTLHPGTQLHGRTVVRSGAAVGPDCTLTDTEVDEGARVVRAHCEGAYVGPGASVGPWTYLRPGTRLGRGAKAGAYTELKAADVGDGSKVPHLSYVGDAVIGAGSNIGAATVFVNYDGVAKHRTVIGDHVRIGSDSMLVAPVAVGDGAYTAAGSVITDDVPPGAMAVGRARQRNIEGWVERKRAGTPSAEAAARAGRDTGQQDDGRHEGDGA